MKYPWQNILYIDALGKTIPYQSPAGEMSAGTGFINLKRDPDAAESIPETFKQSELLAAIKTINGAKTGVFSVGCEINDIAEEAGHKTTGYIEFSVNDQSLVVDSASYYSLFFQFQNRLAQTAFPHTVQFDWVIIPALFTEIGIQGFTCSVKINTAFYASATEAQVAAYSAISLLGDFLADVDQSEGKKIY